MEGRERGRIERQIVVTCIFSPSIPRSLPPIDGRGCSGQPPVAVQRQGPLYERLALLHGYGGRGREGGWEGEQKKGGEGTDALKGLREGDKQGWRERKERLMCLY